MIRATILMIKAIQSMISFASRDRSTYEHGHIGEAVPNCDNITQQQ